MTASQRLEYRSNKRREFFILRQQSSVGVEAASIAVATEVVNKEKISRPCLMRPYKNQA